ncbi:MAG TPA: MFS transporter [Gemmataceae bacterium]|nr:MFS transporter [Gemmataceae bacterium]
MSSPASSPIPSLGATTRILVIIIASIGFLFDTYELLMFPVIGSSAVSELIHVNKDGKQPGWAAELGFSNGDGELVRGAPTTSVAVRSWGGRMQWVAALCGGFFGLLGGLLIDRLGRKTIMIASILAYSLSPVAGAFSTELWHLVLFRSTTFIGVCVEMIAAVTWLAELFDDKRTRELIIGWTLATASLGGILVTAAFKGIRAASEAGSLPAIPFPEGYVATNVAWRFTLLTGLIPGAAILLLMPFVPESGVWKRKMQEGTLQRPGFGELFSSQLWLTTLVTTILAACGYAAAFGAIQMTPLFVVAGTPKIASLKKEADSNFKAAQEKLKNASKGSPEFSAAEAEVASAKKDQATAAKALENGRGDIQLAQEIGGLLGRVALAILLLFVPSRWLIRMFLIPGVILFPVTYFKLVEGEYFIFAIAIFFCGLLTVAQFSFLSEFLPRVFPMHLRGTGGSFATNLGGRMIGTMAATLNTELLAPMFPGTPPLQVAAAAGVIGGAVYFIALVATFFLPHPHEEVEKQVQIYGKEEALNEPKSETVD